MIYMKAELEAIAKQALEELKASKDLKSLDAVRVKYLGKKGELTAILKQMGKLSAEERPVIGQLANQLRTQIEEKLDETKKDLRQKRWICALPVRPSTSPCPVRKKRWAKNTR